MQPAEVAPDQEWEHFQHLFSIIIFL